MTPTLPRLSNSNPSFPRKRPTAPLVLARQAVGPSLVTCVTTSSPAVTAQLSGNTAVEDLTVSPRADFPPRLLEDAVHHTSLTMPPRPPPSTYSKLVGFYKAERSLPRFHTTPQFPDFMAFTTGTWVAPAKAILPLSCFSPFITMMVRRVCDGHVQVYLAPDSVVWATWHPLPPKREAEMKLLRRSMPLTTWCSWECPFFKKHS
ncbi:hypothetical protein AAFF_G00164450 [Aldrovandia affinis]|uniref:Uncharacterized protein n=1 Tax=Aldrovandia affinis TaxID=143900 RepID=A0AAD7T0P7_9TELE|nr:hypothetical protein AAFF_G00164450 [Aldrovandia affinis]